MNCLRNPKSYNHDTRNELENSKLFFDFNLKFKNIIIDKTVNFDRSKNKPTKFVLSVERSDIINNLSEYSVLYKKNDDLRKDHLVLQAITIIKNVRF
jgi:phosphatidylinositol kinase/protein kinase (PI-3  family)